MLRQSYNYLLQKDDVGKAKPSTRTLPHSEHTYGLPGPADEEGVGKCKNNFIETNSGNQMASALVN